jgi:erythromycin esterase
VAVAIAAACLAFASCRSKPPAPPPAPAKLTDSANAALRWIDTHAVPLTIIDSSRPAADRAPFLAFVGNASVFAISELTEGTHQFTSIVQQMLRVLSDNGFRALAIQAPMPEAMDIDHYVRTGIGNPRAALRVLGPHWYTQEVLDLVEWIRAYNKGRSRADQIGFYGFEIPSSAHAIQVLTSIPDSVAGAPLNAWLKRELGCVATGEGAAWGANLVATDTAYWNRCRVVAAAAVDSLVALGGRVPAARAPQVAFAQDMARLLQHHVTVGIMRLPRHEVVAEHVLWLANSLGPNGKLLVWGRDVESGRLTLEGSVIQSAVPIANKLQDRYRNLGFAFGEGSLRAQPIAPGQREPGDERNVAAARPDSGTYEDVLNRARLENVLLDLRTLPSDTAGAWLKGPRTVRLISGQYNAAVPAAFETHLEFPANFDGLIFVRQITPAVPLKR